MSTNIVVIEGALGREPEAKFTTTGKAVTNFSVAVDNGWGQNKKDPFWFNVVTWNALAETAARDLSKGIKVTVYGRLTTRKYTNKSGVEVTVTEIVANALDIREPRDAKPATAPAQDIQDSDIPF